MKLLKKMTACILLIGCILFGIGTMMGGEVYAAYFSGKFLTLQQAGQLGWNHVCALYRRASDQVISPKRFFLPEAKNDWITEWLDDWDNIPQGQAHDWNDHTPPEHARERARIRIHHNE